MLANSASGLQAQSVGVNLDAGVSHARPPSGVTAEPSTYAMAGARISAGPALGSLYGALRVDGDAGDWLAASLGARLARAVCAATAGSAAPRSPISTQLPIARS